MGLMILAGSIVGLVTAAYGVLHAVVANRRWDLPLRETPDVKVEELEAISRRDEADLPPLSWSLVPILLPVVLIGGLTIAERTLDSVPGGMQALGDKNIAVLLAAVVSMGLLVRTCGTSLKDLSEAVQQALGGAGIVILVTSGGGAFGAVLQQTDVAGLLGRLPSSSPALMVGGAFLITAAIRTAQGSSTVAMITAAGIFAGVAHSGQLPFHAVYLALAIGCGSKPLSWMNDSGFWVITRMSGMTEAEGLKYVTPMTGLMGLIGGLVTMLGAVVFPLK
jgi:GntP family gluconate:H+ symporter